MFQFRFYEIQISLEISKQDSGCKHTDSIYQQWHICTLFISYQSSYTALSLYKIKLSNDDLCKSKPITIKLIDKPRSKYLKNKSLPKKRTEQSRAEFNVHVEKFRLPFLNFIACICFTNFYLIIIWLKEIRMTYVCMTKIITNSHSNT